jgi:uncharacterized protein YndB with AHSA1/START domain
MTKIKLLIAIKAPAEKVFPLVATAAGFAQWWAADVTEHGDDVTLGFFNRSSSYQLQRTRAVTPGDAAASVGAPSGCAEWLCLTGQEWQGTRIVFDLAENKGMTLVRFTHADWKSETDYFTSCTTTWGELMFRLKAAAEGKGRGPLFSAADMVY